MQFEFHTVPVLWTSVVGFYLVHQRSTTPLITKRRAHVLSTLMMMRAALWFVLCTLTFVVSAEELSRLVKREDSLTALNERLSDVEIAVRLRKSGAYKNNLGWQVFKHPFAGVLIEYRKGICQVATNCTMFTFTRCHTSKADGIVCRRAGIDKYLALCCPRHRVRNW